MNKKRKKMLHAGLIATAGIIMTIAIAGYYLFLSGQFSNTRTAYVYLDKDDTADSLFMKVEKAGNPGTIVGLRFLVNHSKYGKKIRTGRYTIKPGGDIFHLYRRLSQGRQDPVDFSINNIRTRGDLAKSIGRQLMMDSAQVAQNLNDTAFCVKMGFNAETIVCMFLPNTYEIYWDIKPEAFFERMKKEEQAFWTTERLNKAKAAKLTPVEVCTVASIVDEETNNIAEKPMVAGLYLNRLHQGMKLQADPTVKFAVQNFALKRVTGKELRSDSPYNTYRYEGLPPGPIRIPSIKGIESVLNYVKHDYVYMCAKEDFSGTHNFAATWAEHQKNAKKYQSELNKRKIF